MGLGEAKENAKILETAVKEIGLITGQRPVVTKAKKSIANFKVRQGMPVGAKVTLRGDNMYEFIDKFLVWEHNRRCTCLRTYFGFHQIPAQATIIISNTGPSVSQPHLFSQSSKGLATHKA